MYVVANPSCVEHGKPKDKYILITLVVNSDSLLWQLIFTMWRKLAHTAMTFPFPSTAIVYNLNT